eukprot:gb/GFBE01045397.1/.p1 GENE.gb/GFBE01045397.1/~~gb/GFBE01045397.1/.p1  ORF type:complete len:141 (+),score=38.41 gb/GFBE01045397.1/:1-423(+)
MAVRVRQTFDFEIGDHEETLHWQQGMTAQQLGAQAKRAFKPEAAAGESITVQIWRGPDFDNLALLPDNAPIVNGELVLVNFRHDRDANDDNIVKALFKMMYCSSRVNRADRMDPESVPIARMREMVTEERIQAYINKFYG